MNIEDVMYVEKFWGNLISPNIHDCLTVPTVSRHTNFLQTRSLRENSNFDSAVPMTTFIVGKHEKSAPPPPPRFRRPCF